MSSLEQTLLDFDPKKENIPRQITSICPTRNLYPETQRHTWGEEIKTMADDKERRVRFEIEGVSGLIETREQAISVAASLARYKYSTQNAYISDIGAGLYTMITTGAGLYDYRELVDGKTGEKIAARVTLSLETLYKAAFGPLVNDNGRAIFGAGDIVGEAKERIMPIVDGKVPMPRAYASVHKKKADGSMIEAIIEGEPLRIYRKMSGARDALVIDLDYFFFPAIEKTDGGMKANDLFINQVAGMTSFLQLGRLLVGREIAESYKKKNSTLPEGSPMEKRPPLPEITTARKILLAAQAAYELRYFAKDIAKETGQGRLNIALRRTAIHDLYPAAVDLSPGKKPWYRFQDFSNAVSLSGQFFRAAMKATGIEDQLAAKGNVLIPATDRGAEFPQDRPGVVLLKADRIEK